MAVAYRHFPLAFDWRVWKTPYRLGYCPAPPLSDPYAGSIIDRPQYIIFSYNFNGIIGAAAIDDDIFQIRIVLKTKRFLLAERALKPNFL
jgi:hypothetical protein